MIKTTTSLVLVFAKSTGESFVALAIHEIVRTSAIDGAVDNLIRHVLNRLFPVATHTIAIAAHFTAQRFPKFAMLAARSVLTGAGMHLEIVQVGVATGTALDAKGVNVTGDAVVLVVHGNLARGSDEPQIQGRVDGRITITHKLGIAVHILSFNANAAVSVTTRRGDVNE